MNPRIILCLEHVSLLRSRAVRGFLEKVDDVAIFEPFGARLENRFAPCEVDRALERWRNILQGLCVRRLTFQQYFNEMIEAGEEAIRFLEDEGASHLKKTPVYRRLERLLQSDAIMLALKKGLANYVKDRIQFCKIIARLAKEPGIRVIVAPAHYDDFALLSRCLENTEGCVTIPEELQRVGARRDRLHVFRYFFFALAGIPVRLTRHALKTFTPLTLTRPRPKPVKWAKHIVAGFSESRTAREAVRRDDELEDDHEFAPVHFLYVLHIWRYPAKQLSRWRDHLKLIGARFVDTWRLRMPLGFYLQRKIPAGVQRLLWCWESLKRPGQSRLCEIAHTLVESYVEAHLFMQYYRPKVFDIRDDYLIGHIVRTIVFNRYGCKTIGLHHGAYASLGLNPYIAYTYADTFCAYGPAYFDWIWMGTWSHNRRQAIIGVERNDYTYQAMHNEALRAEFRTKYAGSKVLLWCPTVHIPTNASMLNRPELLEGYCRVLISFLTAHRDWTVVVRSRAEHQALFVRLLDSLGNPQRIVIEAAFSTYDLIAYADGVLAANLSTVGIEAICAGLENVLFLSYWGTWRHPFQRYSSTLVVTDPKDLAGRLEGWVRGDSGHDPAALEAFRRDFDVGFDGRARERFKQEIRRLAGLEPSVPERR